MSATTNLGRGGGGTRTRNFTNMCKTGGRDRNTYIIRPRRSTSYGESAYIVVDRVAWLEFNVLFQHKYSYIRDDTDRVAVVCRSVGLSVISPTKTAEPIEARGWAQVVTY